MKQANKQLKSDVQQVQAAANATFEAQLSEAKLQIEEQLSQQLNSTISEHLSRQFEERLQEARAKNDGQKYKAMLAEKEREHSE